MSPSTRLVPRTTRPEPDPTTTLATTDTIVVERPAAPRVRAPIARAAGVARRISGAFGAVVTGPDRSGALMPLTGLRWIAALYIVLLHTGLGATAQALAAEQPTTGIGAVAGAALVFLARVGTFGYVATGFFLVLGGYALAIGYLDRTTGAFRRDKATFWRSRFVRFFPLLLLTQAFRVPQYLMRERESSWTEVATSLGVHLVGLQAWFPDHVSDLNYPAWTMTLLFASWALFPWIGPHLARRTARELTLALVACQLYALATAIMLPTLDAPVAPGQPAMWRVVLYTHPLVRGVDILSGMLLACLHRKQGAAARRFAPALLVASVAALLGACATSGTELPVDLARNGLLLAPTLALLVALVEYSGVRNVEPRGWLSTHVDRLGGAVVAALTRPWILRCAEVSFTLYLVHAVPMSALTAARHVVAGRPVVFGGDPFPAHALELPLIGAYLVGVTLLSFVLHRRLTIPLQNWVSNRLPVLNESGKLKTAAEPAAAATAEHLPAAAVERTAQAAGTRVGENVA